MQELMEKARRLGLDVADLEREERARQRREYDPRDAAPADVDDDPHECPACGWNPDGYCDDCTEERVQLGLVCTCDEYGRWLCPDHQEELEEYQREHREMKAKYA